MSQVLFYAVTASQYAGITTKNPDAIYFITDGNRIYKGVVPYTHPVEAVVHLYLTILPCLKRKRLIQELKTL